PDLISYAPQRRENGNGDGLATHILSPSGKEFPLFSEALAAEIAERSGAPVQMTHLKHGIFDDASISLISSTTVHELCQIAKASPDARRFRPNIVLRSVRAVPFEEDRWLAGVLSFGEADDAPAITVTTRDVRCAMVNIDPDGRSLNLEVMKACVR